MSERPGEYNCKGAADGEKKESAVGTGGHLHWRGESRKVKKSWSESEKVNDGRAGESRRRWRCPKKKPPPKRQVETESEGGGERERVRSRRQLQSAKLGSLY
jgi:hypothetical protein